VNFKALGAILLIAVLTFAALTYGMPYLRDYFFPTTGSVTTIGVTARWLNCTLVTLIDWGIVDNNTEYVMDPINITSTSNVPVTLSLNYTNPINITSLILTWDYTDRPIVEQKIDPGASILVNLHQTVTGNQTTFSYNTVITAIEAT